MQDTSALYNQIFETDGHYAEVKINIAGVDYGQDKIVSLSTSGGLFAEGTLGAGGAVAGEIDLQLYDPGSIPKMAKLIPYYRFAAGNQVSEWIQKGVYYIDTRSQDGNVLTIHGFDDMLKAEQVWYPDQSLEFPMSMQAAATEIAGIMGVTIDSRTQFNALYQVDYPANDWTLRDILRFIAAAHAANWVMTDLGQLRMVPIYEIPDTTSYLVDEYGNAITFGGIRILVGESTGTGTDTSIYVGQRAASLTVSPQFEAITMVRVFVDDNNVYQAGTETGRVLEVDCPYGTQEMANIMLSQVEGFQYQPMTATDALADPALELGDAVNVGGVLATVVQTAITFDAMMAMDLSAPGQEEIESEYPYVSKQVSQFNHDLAETRSLIAKTSEEILLQVSNELDKMSSSIDIQLNSINLRVQETEDNISSISMSVDSINLKVEGYDEDFEELGTQISEISLKMDSLTLSVSNDKTSSTLKLMAGSTQLSSAEITFTGFVTFSALSGAGQTQINGANITTGKISADRIDASELRVTEVWNANANRAMIVAGGSLGTTVYVGGDGSGWQSGETQILGDEITIGASSEGAAIQINTTTGRVTSPSYWQWGSANTGDHLGDFYISSLRCDELLPYIGRSGNIGNTLYPIGEIYVDELYFASSSTYYLTCRAGGALLWGGKVLAAGNSPVNAVNANLTATIHFGGATSSNYIIAEDSELRPSVLNSSSGYSYLGIAGAYWSHAYIGKEEAHIGLNTASIIAFFGANGTTRQTLSTTSQNQGYSSANANNYLTVLNNIVGILEKLGLITA